MTSVNWPLLTQTLDFIHKNPKLWDQSDWACGTTRCIAGHAAEFAGLVPKDHAIVDGGRIIPVKLIHPETGQVDYGLDDEAYDAWIKTDSTRHVSDVGLVLGLDDEQEELFSCENTWDDVMQLVSGWADEDGVPLPQEWFA